MKLWLRKTGRQIVFFLNSIRFRLTLWSVAILAVILLVFCGFVYYRQAEMLRLDIRSQLQLRTQQLSGLYRYSGVLGPDEDHFQPPDLAPRGMGLLPDTTALAFVSSSGRTLQKAGGIDDQTIAGLVQNWDTTQGSDPRPEQVAYTVSKGDFFGLNVRGQSIYLLSPLITEHHLVGLIILGSPIDPEGQLPRLMVTLILASLATLGIALAGGYWLAARAMSPVRTITRTARGISESDLHKRLNLGKQDELGELANTFDAMLDRLQAAFDRQRQFTADASHELRTPLTIVGLETEQALSRRRSPEEYERTLKVVKSENEFMSHLVNDLLTLARMDAGQTKMKNSSSLDLSDLALDVVERLSSLASRAGVELHAGDFPEARVRGDAQYLSQLLTNLVENAIKYAGGRGHHVCLETGRTLGPGGEKPIAWVRVEDDGPGIPPEHLPHVFDRFYRADQSRARSGDGSELRKRARRQRPGPFHRPVDRPGPWRPGPGPQPGRKRRHLRNPAASDRNLSLEI